MKILKSNQAFTLIEVLASITLLSIVGIMFLTFFSNATLFSEKTEEKLTAINLANELLNLELESIEKKSLDCPTGYPKNKKYGDYSYKVQIICPATNQEKVLNLIPVEISISNGKGANSEITTIKGYLETNPN